LATNNKDFRIKNGLIVDGANATVNGSSVLTTASSIDALGDVTISSPTSGQALKWNGTAWVNEANFTGYDYEIHVSQVDGNDTTGNGDLLTPVASITKALTLVDSQRKTIIVHPGTYTESPSITVQYTTITGPGLIGGNIVISGTVSTSVGCTISGLKMTNLTITTPTGTGNVNILNCEVSGTLTKSSNADYTVLRLCDFNAASITGAGLVAIFGGNPNFITVNNASANVIVKSAVTVAPVLTAGTLSLVDSVVGAAVTNAVTSAASSVITLANCQLLTSALNNVAPVVLNGFYSILNCVYDKPNSTLVASSGTGGTTNAIDYFQYINADNVNAATVNATTLIGNTNASTITTGTISNARTSANSANGASTIVARDANGSFAANVINATTFSGSGASLTSIPNSSLVNNSITINGNAVALGGNITIAGSSGNSFETISANGTSVVADSSTDTLTITPGDGISITGNATSDTITFTPNVAGASANGIVTTGTQTFAGEKTFTGNVAGTNISVTGNVNAATVNATTFTGTASFATTANAVAVGNVTGLGTNVSTFLATPNSLNLLNTVPDETGSGSLVFATSPALTTPNIGSAIGTSVNVTGQLISTVATGTAPLAVTSTTMVTNLTAQVATQVNTISQGATNANRYLTFVDSNNGTSGAEIIYTHGSLYYNASDSSLSANYFIGTGANVTNVNATTVNATTLIGNTNASTITTGTIDNARTSANTANGASTIVARDANGSFTANVVTATTFNTPFTRTNLVTNPNLELNASNWTATNGGGRVTTSPYIGTYCFQGDSDGETGDSLIIYSQSSTLAIGTSYRVGVWVRASTNLSADAGQLIGNFGSATVTKYFTPTTSWQFVELPAIVASQTALSVSIYIPSSGQTLFADSLVAELTSTYTGTFFDGNTPDAGGIDYGWTGTANASTSTANSFLGLANLSGATFTGNIAGTNISLSGNVNAVTVNATTFIGNTNAATITGTVADGTTTTAASGVGYMGIPRSAAATTLSYGVVAADAGKHIYTTANRNVTIPANSNVAFPIGSTLVFINGNATSNILISTDTMYLSGIGSTGTRTLAPWGMATAIKISSNIWMISGNGLT